MSCGSPPPVEIRLKEKEKHEKEKKWNYSDISMDGLVCGCWAGEL